MTGPSALLELSDERDLWLRRVLAAEVRGYDRGREAGYAEGRRDEAAARDEDWAALARPVARGGLSHAELERRRWKLRGEERTRQSFAEVHPDDGPARPVPALERVWLGGPPVHYRHDCTAACRAINPRRPYSPAEAAAVLAGLPGDYGDEIARLRQAGGG